MNLTHDLEHQFWKTLKQHGLEQRDHFLLAISGGLDSMVLLELMVMVKPQAQLTVAYYHHGESDVGQNQFRNEAQELVRARVEQIKNADFITERSSQKLTSEEQMRDARWSFLRKSRKSDEPILTAHHQDDWVETLTLKLIRGTSGQGFSSFQVWNQEIFRPLLMHTKSELKHYAEVRKLKWSEDPSNLSTDYLRNWLRESWFQSLEAAVPGGYKSFARSLLNLTNELTEKSSFQIVFYSESPDLGLDRAWFMTLSSSEQLKALALYLKFQKTFSFTRGQLEEIQKRIDKKQKEISFEIVRKWVINATQIMLA